MSVLKTYHYFVFDVDRTLAENKRPIPNDLIDQLSVLIEHVNIALVTSRSMGEDLGSFADSFCQQLKNRISSDNQLMNNLYIFPTTAAQAYQIDLLTGKAWQLYDRSKDHSYQRFYNQYRADLELSHIHCVDDVQYDESEMERKVQIHDRGAQVTLFFSHMRLRDEYEGTLKKFNVSFIRHARNVLHIVPVGINKKYAVEYLLNLNQASQFLVFADGFYRDPKTTRQGNDFALTELSKESVTCIQVGEKPPQAGSNVWHYSSTSLREWRLTNAVLTKIISLDKVATNVHPDSFL